MANIKISDLTPAAAVLGTQEFEVNDSLTSKKVTAAQMLSYINANSGAVDLTSAQTITGVKTFSQPIVGSVTGSAATATSAGSVTGTTTAAVPTSALGSGTANSTTFLAGDRSFKTVQTGPATGDILTTSRTLSAPDYLVPDNSVYLQSTYPALFGVLGLVKNPYDATNFTQGSLYPGASPFTDYIKFLNGAWYAVGSSNGGANTSSAIFRSTNNGSTWTNVFTSSSDFSFVDIESCGSTLVAVAQNNVGQISRAFTSTNGTSWTTVSLPRATNNFYAGPIITSDNVNTLFMGSTNQHSTPLRSTNNGASWATVNTGNSSNVNYVVHLGGTTWLSIGNSVGDNRISTNGGSTWSNITLNVSPPTSGWRSISAYTVPVGSDVRLYLTYTDAASEANYQTYTCLVSDFVFSRVFFFNTGNRIRHVRKIINLDNVFYAHIDGTPGGGAAYSTDGVNWNLMKTSISNQFDLSPTHFVFSTAIRASFTSVYTYNSSTQFLLPNYNSVPQLPSYKTYIKT